MVVICQGVGVELRIQTLSAMFLPVFTSLAEYFALKKKRAFLSLLVPD